jgi:hypothetical protein
MKQTLTIASQSRKDTASFGDLLRIGALDDKQATISSRLKCCALSSTDGYRSGARVPVRREAPRSTLQSLLNDNLP